MKKLLLILMFALFLQGTVHAEGFSPIETKTLSATTTSSSSTFSSYLSYTRSLIIQNAGSVVVFVKLGKNGSATATTSDTPILPGAIMLLNKTDFDTVAVRTGSGTATVYATAGEGN